MNSLFQYFGILFGIYWVLWLAGFFIVRSGTGIGRKLEVVTWNSRIRLWNRQTVYDRLFTAMEEKKYILASFLVVLFNFPMLSRSIRQRTGITIAAAGCLCRYACRSARWSGQKQAMAGNCQGGNETVRPECSAGDRRACFI